MSGIPYLREDEKLNFPLTYDASGLVALGGNLSPNSLINAYIKGVFPWYNEGEIIQWWSPEPRCILYPNEIKISKSMASVLRNQQLEFKVNENFDAVIKACSSIIRKDQDGTWINKEMIEAYNELHKLGFAMSGECYHQGELVGGMYGLKIGQVYFGESMFSKRSNASKYAFINFIKFLEKSGVKLIDCQLETAHLLSLGAQSISREVFLEKLRKYL